MPHRARWVNVITASCKEQNVWDLFGEQLDRSDGRLPGISLTSTADFDSDCMKAVFV